MIKKTTLLVLFLILLGQTTIAQLSPIWLDHLKLERPPASNWKTIKFFVTAIDSIKQDWLFQENQYNSKGQIKKRITFDEEGQILSNFSYHYPDNFTEIEIDHSQFGTKKTIRTYNPANQLVIQTSLSENTASFQEDPFSNDSIYLQYNALGQLKKIEKFSMGKTWETFHYQQDTLRKIITRDEILDGSLERIFTYSQDGTLVKRSRIKDGVCTRLISKQFNKKSQLIEIVDLFYDPESQQQISQEFFKMTYHPNGKMHTRETIYIAEEGQDKRLEVFDNEGMLVSYELKNHTTGSRQSVQYRIVYGK